MLIISEYLVCRTGSTFPVVSRYAVFESDDIFLFHIDFPPRMRVLFVT
jgi:hypothetical protein